MPRTDTNKKPVSYVEATYKLPRRYVKANRKIKPTCCPFVTDVGRKAYFFDIKANTSWKKILYFNTSVLW